MAAFATALTGILGNQVVDETELKGAYDFKLELAMAPAAGETRLNTDGVLAGLQDQLGLKLESRKAQVERIVIDSVEKPSAN